MTNTQEASPRLKIVKPINFLYFRAETTVGKLVDYLPMAKDLQREAVNYDLRISGPVHWHYFGFMGDLEKPFILEVAVPVEEVPAEYDGKFHFKRTETFTCVSLVHQGSWQSLPNAYGRLMKFMEDNQLTPTANNREIYINADFQYPEANETEVQIGVAETPH